MNLENKIVTLQTISSTTYPPETKVTVSVKEEISDGVYVVKAYYDITFDKLYNFNDPGLLSAVNEKLSALPEI